MLLSCLLFAECGGSGLPLRSVARSLCCVLIFMVCCRQRTCLTFWTFFCSGVPVLLLAEIPFMMAKFATFDAFSKLAYSVFPQATESVAASLAVSLVSGMVGELQSMARRWWRGIGEGGGALITRFFCWPLVGVYAVGLALFRFKTCPRVALVSGFDRGEPIVAPTRAQSPGSASWAAMLRYVYLLALYGVA